MSALSKRHFTNGSAGDSASKRPTLLRAAAEAGLDAAAAEAFLESGELHDAVWRSYGVMPRRGISAIPLFIFHVPELGLVGGPLREGPPTPYVINGSHL